jgi:hypothetical protein
MPMKTVFLCVVASLMLLGCSVTINYPTANMSEARKAAGTPQVRGALSGQRQLIFSVYTAAADCTSLGYPTMKVLTPPQHGQVSVEQGVTVAGFGGGDSRVICNGKSFPSTVIYYTSEPGFIGADLVAFERIGVAGAYAYHAFTINVR